MTDEVGDGFVLLTPLKQQLKLFFLCWSKQAFGIRVERGTVNIQHMA